MLAKSLSLVLEYHIFNDKSCHFCPDSIKLFGGKRDHLNRKELMMRRTALCFTIMGLISTANGSLRARVKQESPPERIRKDLSISYKEEHLNGTVLVQRQDWDHVSGQRKQTWMVDGKQVDKEVYEKAYHKAEKQQRIKERQYQERIEIERHERVQHIAVMGSLRLLELSVVDIELALKKLDDKSLRPFLQFADNSIASQELLDQLQDEWLPQARKVLRSSSAGDIQAINELLVSLEPMPYKLSEFFYSSVEYGIKNADDPKLLKKWLSVVV